MLCEVPGGGDDSLVSSGALRMEVVDEAPQNAQVGGQDMDAGTALLVGCGSKRGFGVADRGEVDESVVPLKRAATSTSTTSELLDTFSGADHSSGGRRSSSINSSIFLISDDSEDVSNNSSNAECAVGRQQQQAGEEEEEEEQGEGAVVVQESDTVMMELLAHRRIPRKAALAATAANASIVAPGSNGGHFAGTGSDEEETGNVSRGRFQDHGENSSASSSGGDGGKHGDLRSKRGSIQRRRHRRPVGLTLDLDEVVCSTTLDGKGIPLEELEDRSTSSPEAPSSTLLCSPTPSQSSRTSSGARKSCWHCGTSMTSQWRIFDDHGTRRTLCNACLSIFLLLLPPPPIPSLYLEFACSHLSLRLNNLPPLSLRLCVGSVLPRSHAPPQEGHPSIASSASIVLVLSWLLGGR